MKKTALLFFSILCVLNINYAQDFATSNKLKPYANKYAMSNNVAIENAVLEDGNYTYTFLNETISVEIKDGYYYEYHPNKEFIKAKIDWITEYEYRLIIVDIERRAAPFGIGSKLSAEITKVEGNNYFYTSKMKDKIASGVFKKT